MDSGLAGIIKLRKDHIKPASQMLARAFEDDPISVYAYSDEADIKSRLPYVYEFLLRYYLRYAQGYATSEQLEGIAVWQRYRRVKISFWHLLSSGAIWPAIKMGAKVGERMQPFFGYIEKKHAELVSFPHWYLILIGVEPESQGKGYAAMLLRSMLSKIDEEGLPCYLETEKAKNVPIYEHFNFRIIDEFIVPDTTVKLWAMLRDRKDN